MSGGRRLDILVSVNDSYIMPLCVMLGSLFSSNPEAHVRLWLLHRGLSEGALDLVRGVVSGQDAELTPIRIDDEAFSGYSTASHISKETYLRMIAADVVPRDLDRILWLDADLLVIGDLTELFSLDFAGNALIACGHEDGITESMVAYCEELGIAPEHYINAGVLLMNLSAWRAADVAAKVREIHDSGRVLKFADQDMLNLIFKDAIGYVDACVYNFRTSHPVSPEQERFVRENGRIIHFCGKMKPWMFSDIPLSDLWREAYRQSPFGSRPLRLITRVGLSRLVGRSRGGERQ